MLFFRRSCNQTHSRHRVLRAMGSHHALNRFKIRPTSRHETLLIDFNADESRPIAGLEGAGGIPPEPSSPSLPFLTPSLPSLTHPSLPTFPPSPSLPFCFLSLQPFRPLKRGSGGPAPEYCQNSTLPQVNFDASLEQKIGFPLKGFVVTIENS